MEFQLTKQTLGPTTSSAGFYFLPVHYIIDKFHSAIWTDRYSEAGEFILVMDLTDENLARFTKDSLITFPDTTEVMIIETISLSNTSSSPNTMTISCRSLTSYLERRMLMDPNQTNDSPFEIFGVNVPSDGLVGPCIWYLMQAALNMDNPFCDDRDIVPFDISWTEDYVYGPETDVDLLLERGDAYAKIKEIADAYDMGFKLHLDARPDSSNLGDATARITVYEGTDRSDEQTEVVPVIFSIGSDTLEEIEEIHSDKTLRNVCYVKGKDKWVTVYGNGMEDYDTTLKGLYRREMFESATDIEGTTTKKTNQLKARGKIALGKQKSAKSLSAKIPLNTQYKYGVDYFMGDIVTLRGLTGESFKARITEYIRSSNAEGDTEYPGFTLIDEWSV